MDEDLFHNEDLSEGNLVLHRDKGVGRVLARTTRQVKGEDTECVKIKFGDGSSDIPVTLAVESGKYSRFDGPKSTSLGKLAAGKSQQAKVSMQVSLERRAEELLHEVGVFHPEILAKRLRTEGYEVIPIDLNTSSDKEYEIHECDIKDFNAVNEYVKKATHVAHFAGIVFEVALRRAY